MKRQRYWERVELNFMFDDDDDLIFRVIKLADTFVDKIS